MRRAEAWASSKESRQYHLGAHGPSISAANSRVAACSANSANAASALGLRLAGSARRLRAVDGFADFMVVPAVWGVWWRAGAVAEGLPRRPAVLPVPMVRVRS